MCSHIFREDGYPSAMFRCSAWFPVLAALTTPGTTSLRPTKNPVGFLPDAPSSALDAIRTEFLKWMAYRELGQVGTSPQMYRSTSGLRRADI